MTGRYLKKGLVFLAALAVLAFGTAVTTWAAYRLDTVSDVWWDDDNITVATWEEVEFANQYEVNLYRGESKVATIKTKKLKHNFERKMTEAGDYKFRVRALAKGSDFRDGYWSDYSDTTYIDESYAEMMRNGGRIDTKNSGPGAGGQESTPSAEAGVVYTWQWIEGENGWWYQRSDGFYPTNGWHQDSNTGKWYFFDAGGYMMTGWIDADGTRYYCGPDGAMVTGAYTLNGVTYQFGTDGSLIME